MPTEPPPSRWAFGDPTAYDPDDDLVGVGADLEPGTLLEAYRRGLFPMPVGGRRSPMAWWSPVSRGVLRLDRLVVSRSLRRSRRRFEIRIDTRFAEVVEACADPRRPGAWIDARIKAAYRRLHDLGWAHSVEAWQDDELAGGLYGVDAGGVFCGESMFFRRPNASKLSLLFLIDHLKSRGSKWLDAQVMTPHMEALGAKEIWRDEFLEKLRETQTSGLDLFGGIEHG